MRKRTLAREIAMQALYQMEIVEGGKDVNLQGFFEQQDAPPDVLEFAESLINGCRSHRDVIEKRIAAVAKNWDLQRMAIIDRCILFLGAHEILYRDDIPPKVSINEAVDMAKKFSTENSGSFVNGILDRIYLA